ncbi:MAG: Hemerythrin cation binding domain protein [Paenibacillus sp.]|nr:Hemerythrin cation binding domain protein [Paenibacillus sp.]
MGLSHQQHLESGTALLTELSEALERLKQEHGELMQVLVEMGQLAGQVEKHTSHNESIQTLFYLRLWTLGFMEELERHSHWEEKQLFPLLNGYFKTEHSPSGLPSFGMMEKDHELALEYMHSFLRAVHTLKSDPKAVSLSQAAACLIQACEMLKQHLMKEEKLVFPMTEQLFTDRLDK